MEALFRGELEGVVAEVADVRSPCIRNAAILWKRDKALCDRG